jgi:hypothetical protein
MMICSHTYRRRVSRAGSYSARSMWFVCAVGVYN